MVNRLVVKYCLVSIYRKLLIMKYFLSELNDFGKFDTLHSYSVEYFMAYRSHTNSMMRPKSPVELIFESKFSHRES